MTGTGALLDEIPPSLSARKSEVDPNEQRLLLVSYRSRQAQLPSHAETKIQDQSFENSSRISSGPLTFQSKLLHLDGNDARDGYSSIHTPARPEAIFWKAGDIGCWEAPGRMTGYIITLDVALKLFGTYAPSRLSSACSCILTATPSPTTVITTIFATVTANTATSTTSSTCSVATPVVKNGGFESGSLAPWTLTNVIPSLPDYDQYLSVEVTKPGYGGSQYAFTVNDQAASSYVEIDIEQTLTLCPSRDYNFAAKFYMTDAHDGPQTYVQAFINGQRIASSTAADASGPPIVWKSLAGRFTATSSTVTLKVNFVATDYLGVQWGVDDVVVTPA
ncbi:MAG: hypothetical protein Q9181_002112 [Wetmoreana brouardii]